MTLLVYPCILFKTKALNLLFFSKSWEVLCNPEEEKKASSPSLQILQHEAVIQLCVPKEYAVVVFRVHLLFGISDVQHEENKLPRYLLLSGEKLQDLLDCVLLGVLLKWYVLYIIWIS